MDSKSLKKTLGSVLKEFGFSKSSSDTWNRTKMHSVQVINLQKSNYSNQFYLNLGVWFSQLDEPPKNLKEHLCHLRTRMSAQHEAKIDDLLNLDNGSVDENQRELGIVAIIKDCIIPFFDKYQDIVQILSEVKENKGHHPSKVLIQRALFEYLNSAT